MIRRRGKAYSRERRGWFVILEKTSLRPGAEHSLPSAVEPIVRYFSSPYKSTKILTVVVTEIQAFKEGI